MIKNREIRDEKEVIVTYEEIVHPITLELTEMPVKITETITNDEYEIAYEVVEDKLVEHKTKTEKVTTDKIMTKLQELETKIDALQPK